MTLLGLALVLVSAVVHATWNLLAKASGDKLAFSWCATAAASIIYAPLAIYTAWQGGVAPGGWVFPMGTAVLHILYFLLLAKGYQSGDLSVVYPIARGIGPALVPVLGVLILREHLSRVGAAGVAAVVCGLFVINLSGLGRLTWSRLALPGAGFAVLTGLVISTYTLWDKVGVGLVAPALYNYFPFLGPTIGLAPLMWARKRALVAREWRVNWRAVIAVGVLSPLAYLLVLTALTFSPVSYIAPAREVSIPIGALLGALVLGEPYGRWRIVGSVIIASGVALLSTGL